MKSFRFAIETGTRESPYSPATAFELTELEILQKILMQILPSAKTAKYPLFYQFGQ